jgi:hypothetical protein
MAEIKQITSGSAPKTSGGRMTATGQYNSFVDHANLNENAQYRYFEIEENPFYLKSYAIYRQFAYFLAYDAVKNSTSLAVGDDDMPLDWRTVLQYLSGFVNAVVRKVCKVPLTAEEILFLAELSDKSDEMTNIRYETRLQMIRQCILKGIPVIMKPVAVPICTIGLTFIAFYSRRKGI